MTLERLLCVSLLRAGDALVQLPAIANLAQPGREVHLLLQPVAKPAAELLAPFAQVHFLPRNYIGGELDLSAVTPSVPALDRVLNLTLTKPAAELAERLAPGRAEGIVLRGGRARFTSRWLELLDDWGVCAPLSVIHYGDIFSRAVSASPRAPELHHSEQDALWWAKARRDISTSAPLVFLQLTTSEAKKSYPRARFLELALALAHSHPDAILFALGAPAERERVRAFSQASGGRVRPFDCTLPQAACALRDASLLISGDTALVHLAALAGARVLLLSSGSSAFRELGPMGAGHTILHANPPCAPCKHDLGCIVRSDGVYPCTKSIEPLFAAEVAGALLRNQPPPVPSSPLVSAYASTLDGRGLVSYTNLGIPTPADLCTAVLRAHLLADLAPGLPSTPDEIPEISSQARDALRSMAALLDGLLVRAQFQDRAPLDRALQVTREFMLLELAKHLSGRLVFGLPERVPRLLEELKTLRARVERWL